MLMAEMVDPRQLSLVELRALRARLQNDDDAVSYVRRLAQARLDLVQAEKRRRLDGSTESLSDELPALSGEELINYADALHAFEQARSHERRELFTRIDELSAELVRRYRDGE